MAEYVHQPDFPYSAYLQLAVGENPAHEPAAGSVLAAGVGSPEPTAPPEVMMEPQEWHTGVEGADAPFEWPACGVLLQRGQFALGAIALKKGVRTEAECWAIDQYVSARELYHGGLFAESLSAVQAALDGAEGRAGNPKDYRALFLVGLIRLGSRLNRAPSLHGLSAAEDAFVKAARGATELQPADAAWAYAAAAWAAYCRGQSLAALSHARLALALRSRFGEANYLAAKALVHERQADAARSFYASAISVHPWFARRALRDADFVRYAAKFEPALDAERERSAKRAEAAIKAGLDRAAQAGLWEAGADKPAELPPGTGAGKGCAMLLEARRLADKRTLFGSLEAEAIATRAGAVIHDAVSRSKADRRNFEQAVRQAGVAIEKLAQRENGAQPLSAKARKELRRAGEQLAETEPAVKATTLCEFLVHQEAAQQALAAAVEAVEFCRGEALQEANARRAELEAELNGSAGVDEAWTRFISKGAGAGLGLGGLIAVCTAVNSAGGAVGDSGSLIRGIIVAIATSVVGAVLGAVIGPLANSNSLAQRERLESERSEVDEAIEDLSRPPVGSDGL